MTTMKQLLTGFAACALLLTGCTEQDITERAIDGQGQLIFSTGIGKQATKTAELMNSTLQTQADGETTGIVLWTYQESATTPGTFGKWFDDNLWHNGSEWKIGTTRFRNTVRTKFITYFPRTNVAPVGTTFKDATFVGDPVTNPENFPAFTYKVNTTSANQEDLIAGITNIAANQKDITIGLRHILSQVNFGTRGYKGAKITIANIKIVGLFNSATYTYKKEDVYTIGEWTKEGMDGNIGIRTASYDYNNYKNGSTTDNNTPLLHQTTPVGATTGDIYVFGDGGNWGPGKDATTFYPVGTDNGWVPYSNDKPQTGLANSLMLMPQKFKDVSTAKVTFEYTIQDTDGAYVAGNASSGEKGEFKLDFNTKPTNPIDPKPEKHYLGQWDQNYRYLYLIDFTDFLDGSALTFKVDVEMYPWENYDGEGGIINIMAAGQPTTANMDKIADGQPWYIASQSMDAPNDPKFNPVKWAQVIRDEAWDLSTYDFTSIVVGNTFNLNFQNVIFNTSNNPQNGTPTKIDLTLPEGFSAKATETNPTGIITFTGTNPYVISEGDKSNKAAITITNEYYYATLARLEAGVLAATDKQKFVYGGMTAVDLKEMEPTGSAADQTITVKFSKSVIPTVGATTNGNWDWNATSKTATWTEVDWTSETLATAQAAVIGATADATIYCSDATDITSLATTFSEPTNTGVSTIKVVFNATATRTGDTTANGAWTYDAKSKTATWTR